MAEVGRRLHIPHSIPRVTPDLLELPTKCGTPTATSALAASVTGHGLSRAVGAPGSASQNFILGTNLEFRPTQTVHRRSSPKTQYRQITNRGFGGIRSTSTSMSGALAEVCFSPVALTDSSVATFGLTSASRGSLTTAYLPFRLILAGKSVLISNSISTFLLSALPPPILLLYFPELLM